jgi:hypothetical protein
MKHSTKKKLIMVSSRFGGKEENIKRAEEFCKYIVRLGHIPVAPHVYFPRFLDDLKPEERELGIEGALALMAKCDEVWFFLDEGEKLSQGMKEEAALMVELNMPFKVVNSNMVKMSLVDDDSFMPRFFDFKAKLFNNSFDEQDWHLIYKDNSDS